MERTWEPHRYAFEIQFVMYLPCYLNSELLFPYLNGGKNAYAFGVGINEMMHMKYAKQSKVPTKATGPLPSSPYYQRLAFFYHL